MLQADVGEAAALTSGGNSEELIRVVEVLLCEVLQVDRLLDWIGKRRALRTSLGLLAVFEAENPARTLQGEPAFFDQEQQ